MMPSSSVSSRLSGRGRQYQKRRVRQSGNRLSSRQGVCMTVLWTLPAMTICSTPSRLKQRIIRPSRATPAQ